MKPLILLLSVFVIGFLVKRLLKTDKISLNIIGRVSMAGMLIFTGIAHFVFSSGMSVMIPSAIPFRVEIIYITGVLEIVAAIGLVFQNTKRLAGICLIVLFILLLPANVYAAIKHIHPTSGQLNGPGVNYLFFRVPLQFFFIRWVYHWAVK